MQTQTTPRCHFSLIRRPSFNFDKMVVPPHRPATSQRLWECKWHTDGVALGTSHTHLWTGSPTSRNLPWRYTGKSPERRAHEVTHAVLPDLAADWK